MHVLLLNANGTAKSSLKLASGTNGVPELTNLDFFGASLASLGDLNGDGITDLAVGATGDDTGGPNRGAVHVLFLKATNAAPIFVSSASPTVLENSISVVTLETTDADLDTVTYSITGGTDQSKFEIVNGVLQFRLAPDFENPSDSNTDNVYEIQVQADDGQQGVTTQTIQVSVTDVDDTAPTLAITPRNTTTNASPVTFTFQFSETVTGFDASDVSVTNGTKGNLTAIDGDTYSLIVTPITDGTVSVSVSANAAQDAASNGSTSASASIIVDRTPTGPGLPNDAATLLLLPFDGTLTGAAGESPFDSIGTSFVVGLTQQAVHTEDPGHINYATDGNILAAQGTIEFWIRPDWNGDTNTGFNFFEVGDNFNNGMLLAIDGANNLRFIQWGDDPSTPAIETYVERGIGFGAGNWIAGEWHQLAATWDGSTRQLAFYVDGQSVGTISDGVQIR